MADEQGRPVKSGSTGNDNQPGNTGAGSPRLMGTWSRKTNPSKGKVNSKSMNPG